jgi:DNA polymerase
MTPPNIFTMSAEYHLDFETFSKCNLKELGAYRYAADPSTEILLLAIRKGLEGKTYRWYNPKYEMPGRVVSDPEAVVLLKELGEDPAAIVYAHNAGFEQAVTKYRWTKDIKCAKPPQIHQWRCTAAMARSAALPFSLGDVCETLKIADGKDKEGSRLISKFSGMTKVLVRDRLVYGAVSHVRVMPGDDPKDFVRFGDYCVQDVNAEVEVFKRLRKFEFKGFMEQIFICDSRINARGIPINIEAVLKARKIVREVEAELGAEFIMETGFKHTQLAVLQAWLKDYGYPGADMQALTVETAQASIQFWCPGKHIQKVARVLDLKAKLAFAAVKKLDAMINCDCGDGYVRGTLMLYGAGTGRWTAGLIQPQNFKRPTIEDTAGAYQMICDGCSREELEMMYGDAIEVIASCIRHFIQRPSGNFLDADYAAIEARIVCWLAGQEDALRDYRLGIDTYIKMAAAIYDKREGDVTKQERWVGKQAVLGCGFSMWVDAFVSQCAKYGVDIPYELGEKAVKAFRKQRSKVADLWDEFEEAAKRAINNPGKWFPAGPKVKFGVTENAGIIYLVMRLPSGRNIVYPKPAIEWVKRTNKFKNTSRTVEQITFWGHIKGKMWGRCSTYGGMLVENATQGCAFDVMAQGTINAEARGFEVVTLIHDQALGNCEDENSIVDFCAALCDLPAWADGLPITAEGSIAPYYRKD